MRILFTGGGTGGHIFPIIATVQELKKIAEKDLILDLELYYMGPDNFGKEDLKAEEVIMVPVMSGKIRRYFSARNFIDIFKVILGTLQAVWNFFLIMPDAVFSKGGYGALPAVIASVIFRIPLIIHESDAVPGRVNRFSSRFAQRIGIAFAGAADFFPKSKTALVGIPIRKHILGDSENRGKENLGITSGMRVVGFFGASQGSRRINEVVLDALKEYTNEFEVLHQSGARNFQEVRAEAEVILESAVHCERYHSFGFLEERQLRDFYQASDLVVSRAGASSIFEIAAWGKPAILVPLSSAAQDHQRKNAYEYAAAGGAIVVEEENLTPHILLAEVKKLINDAPLLKKMNKAAQEFAKIDAAGIIAREILKLGMHN